MPKPCFYGARENLDPLGAAHGSEVDGDVLVVSAAARLRLASIDYVRGLGTRPVPFTQSLHKGTYIVSDCLGASGGPQLAIAGYYRLLPFALRNGARNARYDEAFDIVRAIKRLRSGLGDAKFADELESIRQSYRAQRNFVQFFKLG